MPNDFDKEIWEDGGKSRTYSSEAAAHYLNQEGNSAITVFIRRGDTRQRVVDILSSAGLQVEVSEPWTTLTEKPGTMGLSVKKIDS